jgi:hypothetical protein
VKGIDNGWSIPEIRADENGVKGETTKYTKNGVGLRGARE